MSHAAAEPVDESAPAEDTRARLLLATAIVLSRRGYTQAHLHEIAHEAGLKSPAIYYHFPSRDALITAALREGQVVVREHVLAAIAALPATTSPADRILAAVEAHLRIELERSDFASAVVRTAGHVPPEVRVELEGEIDAYYDVWRDLLSAAETAGVLRPGLNQSIARMLVIGALNWATEWRTRMTPVPAVVASARTMVAGALFTPS